jgi:exopolyphosphatase/guanosine-5'-triphosphate,3'-diphosphate pyrophosphatase
MGSRLVAVLETGSTGIRLLVAQVEENGQWKAVDSAGRPVSLGRDVFSSGELSRESLLGCISVLRDFAELLSGWGIAPGDAHCIATSALRVAKNRDIFIDRIRQETGFCLSVVDGLEENRLMYLAVRFALGLDLPLFWRANSMILEIGGGSTEAMLLRQGQIVAAHSVKLGTITIERKMRRRAGSGFPDERHLRDAMRNTMVILAGQMDMASVKTLVMIGTNAIVAAQHAGSRLNDHCLTINRTDFSAFVGRIRNWTAEDCMRKLGISYAETEGLVHGLLVLKLFFGETGAEKAVVPLVSIREGCLVDLALGVDPAFQEEFRSQITASAESLGRKYHYEEAHSLHVAKLCMRLFDALAKEHGMGSRQRTMLETAAILHDVGTIISASGHQKHGHYIVSNSDIFGISREELLVIANVVLYHRGEPPSEADVEYLGLQREDRILVLKMASILRVADALDRSHSQKIKDIEVERSKAAVFLRSGGVPDISLELISMEKKADLFQDVFAYKIVLT